MGKRKIKTLLREAREEANALGHDLKRFRDCGGWYGTSCRKCDAVAIVGSSKEIEGSATTDWCSRELNIPGLPGYGKA